MDVLGSFCRSVYQPLIFRMRGLDVPAWEKRVQEYEKLSASELRRHQMAALRRLLGYAAMHSPYYKEVIEKSGICLDSELAYEDLVKLPILTKEVVRNEYERLLSDDKNLPGVFRNMTGGSTGTPLVFSQDSEYQSAAVGTERCILRWWGINPGDRYTAFWGADRELHDWTLRERLMMWLERANMFDSFAMSEEKMTHFAAELEQWQPAYIKGYATSLHLFARFLLANRRFHIRPKAVRSTAETLFDWQRKDIEEAFGCKVFNFYGSREVNNLAVECPHQAGLHVLSGTRIVEVVNSRGEPLPPGEIGKIVVTDLVNRAMPFVRYENGDLGVWSEGGCSCGRPYPVLKQIIGRVSDILVGNAGQFVHGEFITHLFYGVPGVVNFQVVQHSQGLLEIIVQQDGTFDPACMESVRSRICERLGKCEIKLRTVDAFERTSSGKHRFIISHVSPFADQNREADTSYVPH